MDSINIPIIDWSQDPEILRNIYKQTNFDSVFYELIKRDVIAKLSPQLVADPHNLMYDDEVIHKHLIGHLEKFIFNLDDSASQDEVSKKIEHIKTLKQPSKMCRKVLKTGDVLFSCNDCGLDETCVVCIDCFHKSAHKDHNYRMSNTDGGGCCDCGDIEAWKQHPACSDHMAPDQPSLSLNDFEDVESRKEQIQNDKIGILNKISLLPETIPERFFLVCQASLHYARAMLTWDKSDSLPDYIEIDLDDPELGPLLGRYSHFKNYFTVLFNDEVHTYDFVINNLVRFIKCTKMTASIMASTVSRDGRSLIYNDNYGKCNQISNLIGLARESGHAPLKLGVFHGMVLAHQGFALKLIEWIQKMSLLCDAFRVLTAYTLLGTYDLMPGEEKKAKNEETLLEKIMLSNTTYWKVARIDWNELFVTTLLTEYSIKDRFARLITRLYPKLIVEFILDDHDHSVSILSLTTQLYTVPSLVCMLIEEEDALSMLTQGLLDTYHYTKRDSSTVSFENRHTFDLLSLKRGFYIIMDLRHLINIEPTKWSPKLRANVIKSADIFLSLLNSMQYMDAVKRQLGQHVEYEPEWETGMTLQSRLAGYITRLVTYCSLDEEVLSETLRRTQIRLAKDGHFKTVTRTLFDPGHQVACIQYDVSTAQVSVHLPLTRFAAALILNLMQRRPCDKVPYDESLVILDNESEKKHSMVEIMEPSLRTEVMIAQFRSGMWRRNGYSLVNQILYFSGPLLRKEMLDRDILVLQECGAMSEANEFLIHLINKFNLFNWITSETTRLPLVGPKAVSFYNDEEIMTQTMSLGEEFLQLLLTIVGERYRVGVGKIEPDDVIKNEIIQILCIGPSTRSDLAQKLFFNDFELDCVKSVANLRRSNESSTGKYELKEEYYDRFNRFFYHYNRRSQSNALDAQLKRKRTLKEKLICCPPPAPVELTDPFRNLNELLKCNVTLGIIQKILQRALGPPVNSQECSTKAPIIFLASDLQLDQCLHLIGIGLYEQERNPLQFRYVEAAYEKGIFKGLKDCYEIAKRSRDLIYWLMLKTISIIEKLETIDELSEYQTRIFLAIRSLFNSILSTCDTVEQESKKKNSELAAQRRERIMAQMRAKQKEFLSSPSTQQLIAETEQKGPSKPAISSSITIAQSIAAVAASIAAGTSLATALATVSTSNSETNQQQSAQQGRASSLVGSSASKKSKSHQVKLEQQQQQLSPSVATTSASIAASESVGEIEMDCDQMDDDEERDKSMDDEDDDYDRIEDFKDAEEEQQPAPIEESHLCILCRDEQKIGFDKPTMVLLAYIQRSAVLSKNRGERKIPNYALTPTNQLAIRHQRDNIKMGGSPEYSFTSDNGLKFDATFMPSDLFFGPYISTCGHVMHYDCWQGFFDAVVKRETSRQNRSARQTSYELAKNEILCPLCECISNATVPLLPDFGRFTRRQLQAALHPRGGTVFGSSNSTIERSAENLSACLQALRGTVDMFQHVRHIKTEIGGINLSTGSRSAANVEDSSIGSNASSSSKNSGEDKYLRLLQPKPINDVLEDLGENEALTLRDFITTIKGDRIPSSICTKNLLGSIATLAERIYSIGLDLDKSITDVDHARVFMMTTWTVSYTIQAYERIARFKGTPLFEDLESSKNLCLSSLLRFSMGSLMTHQSDLVQSLLVKKLRYLLVNDEHLSSSPCCLDIDAFETFVSIFILLQKLYSHLDDSSTSTSASQLKRECSSAATGGSDYLSSSYKSEAESERSTDYNHQNYPWTTRAYDHEYFRNLLHMMVIFNLLQVSITMQNEQPQATNDEQSNVGDSNEQPTNECLMLHNFYKDIIIASGHPISKLPDANEQFVQQIRARLLPFLRSCSIFFYHLMHIRPDETLRSKSAFHEGKNFPSQDLTAIGLARRQSSFISVSEMLELDERRRHEFQSINLAASDAEFESICNYLNLPTTFNLLLKSRESKHLAATWLRHSRVLILIKSALSRAASAEAGSAAEPVPAEGSSSSTSLAKHLPADKHQHPSQQQQQQQLATDDSSGSLDATGISELMPLKFIRQPHLVNRLIDLPHDYSELVDKVSDFKCPSIRNEDSRTPTMCLVCGIMLCSHSYCCQRDLNQLAANYIRILRRQEALERHINAIKRATAAASFLREQRGARGGPSVPAPADASSGPAAADAQLQAPRGSASAVRLGVVLLSAATEGAQAAATAQQAREGAAAAAAAGALSDAPRLSQGELSIERNINQKLVGSCTYHAHECSGGVGVFLRIRNCQILLLSGRSKGCYMPAPYIDDHGETDFGLMRGNPLHLNKELYERLQLMWMSHSIPKQISRTLEYSSYHSNINWHLH